jgi:hypothetical protein
VASFTLSVAVGFVLAGIPVYYIIHRNEVEIPPIFCTSFLHQLYLVSINEARQIAFIASCISRLRGRPTTGDGWEAVATEGDEQVEMAERHIR